MKTVDAKTLTDILDGASSHTAAHLLMVASGLVSPKDRPAFIEYLIEKSEMREVKPELIVRETMKHMATPKVPDENNPAKFTEVERYNIEHLFKYAVSSVDQAVKAMDNENFRMNSTFIDEVLDATSAVYVLMRLGIGAEGFWNLEEHPTSVPADVPKRSFEAMNDADREDRLDLLYALNEAKNALAIIATPDLRYFGKGEGEDLPLSTRIQTLGVLMTANTAILQRAEVTH